MKQLTPTILDMCCSARSFWFNNHHPAAVYGDIRVADYEQCDGRTISIRPDLQMNFTALPFPTSTFDHVVFDPPHIDNLGKDSYMGQRYGFLFGHWKADIAQGFKEAFRVLKPMGTLIFKWSSIRIPVSQVLELAPYAPLYGHKSGRRSNTHWIAFMKMP